VYVPDPDRGPVLGFDLPGCFAQRALLPAIALVKVDDAISDSEAACLQSLSDSVAAGETADLGMGDSVQMVEKAQAEMGEENEKELERKMRTAQFDLSDFITQVQRVKKMGPLGQLVGMLPGLGQIKKQLAVDELDDGFFKHIEAIIYSMTPDERHNPKIINGSRRRRIARGSGTEPRDVNQLLNQFEEARKIMKVMANSKGRGLSGLFR